MKYPVLSLRVLLLFGLVLTCCGQQDKVPAGHNARSALRLSNDQLMTLSSAKPKILNEFAEVVNKSTRKHLNKTYSADERMRIYSKRKQKIAESQEMYRFNLSSFSMKEYQYTDWTEEELSKLRGLSPPPPSAYLRNLQMAQTRASVKAVDLKTLPKSKDWRTSGCISTPMNQKGCNACYAVATVGLVEAMRCIRGISNTVLAPQQVVDCDRVQHDDELKNLGCNNGWPTSVFLYLQEVGLLASEKCYPYKNRRGACKFDNIKHMDDCVESVYLSNETRTLQYEVLRNEDDILFHVANTGPVVSAIETTDSWDFYDKGILDDPTCKRGPDDVDHAIEIVGYGSEGNLDYWIVKNSLGTKWGEAGYARVRRGVNACSIGHWGWVLTN